MLNGWINGVWIRSQRCCWTFYEKRGNCFKRPDVSAQVRYVSIWMVPFPGVSWVKIWLNHITGLGAGGGGVVPGPDSGLRMKIEQVVLVISNWPVPFLELEGYFVLLPVLSLCILCLGKPTWDFRWYVQGLHPWSPAVGTSLPVFTS